MPTNKTLFFFLIVTFLLSITSTISAHRQRCNPQRHQLNSRVPEKSTNTALKVSISSLPFVRIPVIFHIMIMGTRGFVPIDAIQATIDRANDLYSGKFSNWPDTRFRYFLAGINYYSNNKFLTQCTDYELQMKKQTTLLPDTHLNVWSCFQKGDTLGFAYYPSSYAPNSVWHGIMMHPLTFAQVPGYTPYPDTALGCTFAHEAGHTVGLKHTFENGCSNQGDSVNDTPFEKSAWYGDCTDKDLQRNSCPQPGTDPIKNIMDYSIDKCCLEITGDQTLRIHDQFSQYSPLKYNGGNPVKCITRGDVGTATKYSMCYSTCYKTTTPTGDASPSSGWCYIVSDHTKWGNCCCAPNCPLLPNNLQSIDGVHPPTTPTTIKTSTPTIPPTKKGATLAPTIQDTVQVILDPSVCLNKMNWIDANTYCTSINARICTRTELHNHLVYEALQNVSPSCDALANRILWTGSPCGRGLSQSISARGGDGSLSLCEARKWKYSVACCRDP
jgi:hypothetical protein